MSTYNIIRPVRRGVLTAGPCDRSPGTAPSAVPGSSGPAPLESAPALSPPLGQAAFFLGAIRATKNNDIYIMHRVYTLPS